MSRTNWDLLSEVGYSAWGDRPFLGLDVNKAVTHGVGSPERGA